MLGDESWVVGVDGVRIDVEGFGDDDLGTAALEERAEALVLANERADVGFRPPAVLTPNAHGRRTRPAHEHAAERSVIERHP